MLTVLFDWIVECLSMAAVTVLAVILTLAYGL